MKRYTYSQARQHLSEVLDTARNEKVLITRRGGESFTVSCATNPGSPFDVAPVKTKATTSDILAAIKESRSGRR